MTIKETIESDIASLEGRLTTLRAQLVTWPSEVHAMEAELWNKIKAFFGQ